MIDPKKIQDLLDHPLRQNNLDLIDVVAIPSSENRMVKLRTIQGILDDFDDDGSEDTIGYFLKIKREKKAAQQQPESEFRPAMEGIYLPDGKLNVTFLAQNAELLFSTGEYALARNIYKTILQSGERAAVALLGMGKCFEAEGKLEDARAHYDESLAFQASLETYRRLASVLMTLNKDHQAATALERALNLKDLSAPIQFELHKAAGNSFAHAKKTEEAERHYHKALGIDPNADDIRSNLGALYLSSGRIADARRHFQDAVASNSRNDKALTGLASCFLEQGERRQAHDYFAKSLDIELNNPNAIFHLVKCAYEIKSYATAARIVENYIEIAPVNTNLLYSLAGLQYHLGRVDQASKTAQRILQLQPQHAGANELIGMVNRIASPT